MKLDTKAMRYLSSEDWRVLTAVEQGSRNHEVVPTPLIAQLSNLRGGSGVHKSISSLAKVGLIARMPNAKYDGYRLTYGGLDYLALNSHRKRNVIYSVGNQIGVGKESDIIAVAAPSGAQRVLKIHRLGRISFRTVKVNRDYLRHRTSAPWMYMSRLAATKEFAFLTALHEHTTIPVPTPISQNRHTLVMELIEAFPLRQISDVPDPAGLYAELMAMIVSLAGYGLIHGDFNEFNILIKESTAPATAQDPSPSPAAPSSSELRSSEPHAPSLSPPPSAPAAPVPARTLTPILIDFPQMVSVDHANAEMYFDRDVQCVRRFFARRFGFTSAEPGPFLGPARLQAGGGGRRRLDVAVEASGFSRKMARELEAYMQAVGGAEPGNGDVGDEGEGDEDEDEDEGIEDEDENDEGDEDEEGPDEDEHKAAGIDGTDGASASATRQRSNASLDLQSGTSEEQAKLSTAVHSLSALDLREAT